MKLSLRSMIVAPRGYTLIACDLSQAESWIVAHLAREPKMIEALKYGDIHTLTGCSIFHVPPEELKKDQRYLGKRGNHMLSYDATYIRFAQAINQDSDKPPFITITNAESRKIVEGWHAVYTGVRNNFHAGIRETLYSKRTLENAYGRKRVFYGMLNDHGMKAAYAHVPQSSVADHANGMVHPLLGVEGGVLSIHKNITRPSKGEIQLLNQSHDSVLVMCPKPIVDDVALRIHGYMQRPLVVDGEEFTIPADVEIGERYGELEKYKVPHPYRS